MNNAAGRVVACFAALLVCALVPRTGHAQDPATGVFSELPTALVPQVSPILEPATIRGRVVSVDTQQIAAARQGRDVLSLNLFDDAAVQVLIERVRPTRSGYFISGRPQGMEWGEVRLVVNGPVVVGTVVTPEGMFTIRWGGAGRHVIRQIDPSAESLEDDEVELEMPPSAPPRTGSSIDPPGSMERPAPAMAEDPPTEDGSEVRVLVVYTPAMQTQQGGAAGMEALIDLMIHSANEAFEISGINPRLVLAHSALVNYVEQHTLNDLSNLRNTDDGYMDEVHALRNEHAADLVHLLASRSSGPSGAAGLMSEEALVYERNAAFAVTATDREDVFTHETGHSFGVKHDRYIAGLVTAIYPYSFGYVNNRAFEPGAPDTARWRTVMAYDNQCRDAGLHCPRLMRFSNPDQTHEGDPLGVPPGDPSTGAEGPADARLTINRTAPWVGSFRSEACTDFTVFPETPVAPLDGGELVLEVETAHGCLWEASSQSAFLTPPSDPRHSGPDFLSISVEANPTDAERIGTLSVAGKSIEVRQLATDAGICSRTPTVVRAIAGSRSCDEMTDQHLSQITRLLFNRQGLTSLKTGDFEGLSSLQVLVLEANRLTELPGDLFAGLVNLRALDIAYNRLSELPDGLFDGLSMLERLRMESNSLHELPPGLFADLENLRVIELAYNDLTHLSQEQFADLGNLEELDLFSSALSALPDGVFDGLTQLKQLNLGYNQLNEWPSQPFAGLSELEELNLFANRISDLPADAFAGLPKLKILDLGNNPIVTLPTGLLTGLADLEELSFWNGHLTSLSPDTFARLANLTSLNLHSNEIDEFPDGLFAGLSRLNTLRIGRNRATMLPEGIFSGLMSLQELDLYGNQLNSLPSGVFAGLSALERLNLYQNQLSSLPDGIFSGLSSLETLFLGRNRIDPFPLAVTLANAGDNRFKAVAPTGAPFALTVSVSSIGGTIEGTADTVTIPAGAVESSPISVARAADTLQTVTVDIGMLPDLPETHSGYVLEKDEALPLSMLRSIDPADATLSGLALGERPLDPIFAPNITSYRASVANAVSSATVTLSTSNAGATAAYHDESDAALADADANADGHQVSLDEGENVIMVKVTAVNGESTQTYTIVLTREASNCERTEEVLAAIMEAVPSIDACGYLSNAHLAEITRIDPNGQGISSLKSGDFAGLFALKDLYLFNNQLTALPADIFSGLAALQSLWLNSNELTSLPPDVFSGLSALQQVFLQYNQLTTLPDGLFVGLTNLLEVNATNNAVNPLPLSVSLENVDGDRIKAVTPTGAPFALVLPLRVSSGGGIEGGADSITIPAGAVESGLLSVTRTAGQSDSLTVEIGTLPALPVGHQGYVLEKDAALPIEIRSPDAIPPPAQVTGVEIAAGEEQLDVSWTTVTDADGYKVQWKSGEDEYDEQRQATVSGGDTTTYRITGLTAGIEYTVRVIATRETTDDGPPSEEASATTSPGDPDVNGDGTLNGNDALVMYYAYAFGSLVGDGETGGTAESRQRFLAGYSGKTDPTDDELRAMLRKAHAWAEAGIDEGGDINDDGVIDRSDAYAMYYAYTFAGLLGNGEEGGTARFRTQLLGPLSGKADPTDEDLKDMLRRANQLREDYNR